jgi:adenylate cyclase
MRSVIWDSDQRFVLSIHRVWRGWFLLCCVCGIIGGVFPMVMSAQTNNGGKLSALESALQSAPPVSGTMQDTVRWEILHDLCWELRKTDAQIALGYALQALKIAETLQDRQREANTLNIVGTIYRYAGDNSMASEQFFRALHLADSIHYDREIGYALNNIGDMFSTQRNYQEALAYSQRALPYFLARSDTAGLGYVYHRIAEAYSALQKHDSAVHYAKASLAVRERLQDKSRIAVSLSVMGRVLSASGLHHAGLSYLEEALVLTKTLGQTLPLTTIHNDIATTYCAMKQYGIARSHVEDVLRQMALTPNQDVLLRAYKLMADIAEKQNNLAEALTYTQKFFALRDSVENAGMVRRLALAQVRYEIETQQLQIELLTAQRKTDRVIVIVGGIALIATIALIVVLWRAYHRSQESNRLIAEERDATERERRLSDALLANILPSAIADRLKHRELLSLYRTESDTVSQEHDSVTIHIQSQKTLADYHRHTTVLFADVVGFTAWSSSVSPQDVIEHLNRLFLCFDELAEQYDVEKIKTIGDAYMAAAGVPNEQEHHIDAIIDMARDMIIASQEISDTNKMPVQLRIGVHTGAVVAGVIGKTKFSYDLWGDTVNTASRLETAGKPNTIHVSEPIAEYLKAHRPDIICTDRGLTTLKGKGQMRTYCIEVS